MKEIKKKKPKLHHFYIKQLIYEFVYMKSQSFISIISYKFDMAC